MDPELPRVGRRNAVQGCDQEVVPVIAVEIRNVDGHDSRGYGYLALVEDSVIRGGRADHQHRGCGKRRKNDRSLANGHAQSSARKGSAMALVISIRFASLVFVMTAIAMSESR